MNICLASYPRSVILCTKKVRSVSEIQAFVSSKGSVLLTCNALLASIEQDFTVIGFPVYFLNGEVSLQRHGLFSSNAHEL